MNYFIGRAIYYLSFFEKCNVEGDIDLDLVQIFEDISSIFILSEKERLTITRVFKNADYQALTESKAIKFYIDFLGNVLCDKSMLFGGEREEMVALKNKQEALNLYEKITKPLRFFRYYNYLSWAG